MVRLVHASLGSSSLVAHALHTASTIPLLPREQPYNWYCSNKHTHEHISVKADFCGPLDSLSDLLGSGLNEPEAQRLEAEDGPDVEHPPKITIPCKRHL
jgi:hypothetical protein